MVEGDWLKLFKLPKKFSDSISLCRAHFIENYLNLLFPTNLT